MKIPKPKKSLGQNFLVDKNISAKIVEFFDCRENESVLEIGPGAGSLTELLLKKIKFLTAVELDKRAVEILNQNFSAFIPKRLRIINEDILEINIEELLPQTELNSQKLKIIGNIPYNITSGILFWLFDNEKYIKDAVLTVQKEIADRLRAVPRTKEYSILSCVLNFYGKLEKGFNISPSCFIPQPKVTSTVIKITLSGGIFERENITEKDRKGIIKLVKAGFNQRRKMLRNSIKNYVEVQSGKTIREFEEFLLNLNFNVMPMRPEELSGENFVRLYNLIKQYRDS